MTTKYSDSLVSTDWLAAHLNDDDVKVVDGSWYLPAENRDGQSEFATAHLPGSVFFDIDDISDTPHPLPHMFPDAKDFAESVGKLGITDSDHVIAYDGGTMAAAGRVWWMFRTFGQKRISVLDGGMGKWSSEGRSVESGTRDPNPTTFTATANMELVRSLDDVLAMIGSKDEQILDARSTGRFTAAEPEPRSGMRAGHIPGAFNLPYLDLLAEDGTMRDKDELRPLFAKCGVDLEMPIVTSCGSGISATVLLLGLHQLGHENNALYDGSWSEWGSRTDTPIDT